jgi:hypothetical protein
MVRNDADGPMPLRLVDRRRTWDRRARAGGHGSFTCASFIRGLVAHNGLAAHRLRTNGLWAGVRRQATNVS